jgi:hypothetical protein
MPQAGEAWRLNDPHSKYGLRARIVSVAGGSVQYRYQLVCFLGTEMSMKTEEFARIYVKE